MFTNIIHTIKRIVTNVCYNRLNAERVRPAVTAADVSRDGEDWQRYEPPYYFSSDWTHDGRKVMEALIEQGMVRRVSIMGRDGARPSTKKHLTCCHFEPKTAMGSQA